MLNFVWIGLIFMHCVFQLLGRLERFLVLLLLLLRYNRRLRADMLEHSVYFISHLRIMDREVDRASPFWLNDDHPGAVVDISYHWVIFLSVVVPPTRRVWGSKGSPFALVALFI
jgi:hypothetical protein